MGLGPAEIWQIVRLSLMVSGCAVLISSLLAIPLGVLLALTSFPGRRGIVSILNVGMGLPPVLIGLVVYLVVSRSGPLGGMRLLFTPSAMVLAQTLIVVPLMAALTVPAIRAVDPNALLTARALGASRLQIAWMLLSEARGPIGAVIVAGLGRAISEVGAVLIVGGNIARHTRVLTTAIVLETRKGDFTSAISLGIVLLLISHAVNVGLSYMQEGRSSRWQLSRLIP